MSNLINLAGQRFGSLTVRGRAVGTTGTRQAWWSVQCDCGTVRESRGDLLRADGAKCWKCSGGYLADRSRKRLGESIVDILANNSEFITECGCQIWTAGTDGSGYGQFRRGGKTQGTHRASWVLARGPIPNGMHVLHRCDTPPCINPDHLFLGTPADNVADMIRKQRHRLASRRLYR